MDSTRQQKVSRLIQKDLSNIFQVESRGMYANAMITVTQVRVSPDLGVAKTYLSIFSTGSIDKKDILEKIKQNTKEIRKNLGIRIGKQVRVIPELDFFLDDSLDYIEKIENLLKK
ncbi:MAG TPA: 30S ribosome-binding factor RbfA [Bacteroidales bacterium]|nr:30S ribosome-binding factor RbfA [Bacteroidales bacterium]HPS15990.1 30S ribosome-binding factor RbfA [Bacteroidales bacterium]